MVYLVWRWTQLGTRKAYLDSNDISVNIDCFKFFSSSYCFFVFPSIRRTFSYVVDKAGLAY